MQPVLSFIDSLRANWWNCEWKIASTYGRFYFMQSRVLGSVKVTEYTGSLRVAFVKEIARPKDSCYNYKIFNYLREVDIVPELLLY